MGRSKQPEQTLESIIDASAELFSKKGYEQTSIQDILDITKLSKGGLYHHFKSKDEILEAVMQKRVEYVNDRFLTIIENTKGKNAKETLKKILYQLGTDVETHSLDKAITTQIDPHFVVSGLQSCMKQDAPIVCKLIEEGIKDGSLQTTQPALCSEVFLILLNYWANPILFGRNYSDTEKRLNYLQFVMCQLGLDVIDDNLITAILKAYAE
ncbi:MAG: TetR/AcrR family transcriptional regulator [Eubacteriales bacterium]|nr:TetR/AcrR family transcriptional regulator [Eubacteriales bacterium]